MPLLDHCYYINLEKRKDRKIESEREFNKIGLNVNRWNAVDESTTTQKEIDNYNFRKRLNRNTAAEIACFKSHIGIIEFARDSRFDSVTIFEDDVYFLYDDFIERVTITEHHLPLNWLSVLYGTLKERAVPYKKRFFRIAKSFLGAHAYSINSKTYNFILDKSIGNSLPYDTFLRNTLCFTNKVFCINPEICIQAKSYSNLSNLFKNKISRSV